jgi:hypothetical protein
MNNKRSSFVPFLIGAVLGVLGTIYLPGYVRPYLPEFFVKKDTIVTGTVAAKQRNDNTLLLTVDTPRGAVLITITKKVDEIDLLIGEKNTIDFALKEYSPFVENPRITRVVKEEPLAKPETPKAAEKISRDMKPRSQATTAPSATVPKSAPLSRPQTTK